MITLFETRENILRDPANWSVYLMDFVDDFRSNKKPEALNKSFIGDYDRWDSLLASTAAQLCDEIEITPPEWLESIPACKDPWFVSGMESLKAISLVESPLRFRIRKIFVLENFLNRV